MEKTPKNRIEKKIITGYDFAATLMINELLKEMGEDPYRSELRFEVAEIISNLSRTMSNLYILEASEEEIETELDEALLGEKSQLRK
jgi:hypothetical protein